MILRSLFIWSAWSAIALKAAAAAPICMRLSTLYFSSSARSAITCCSSTASIHVPQAWLSWRFNSLRKPIAARLPICFERTKPSREKRNIWVT